MIIMKETKYFRLTLGERKSIEQSLKEGKSLSEIARTLNRCKDTISREIIRNSIFKRSGGYGTDFNNCANRHACEEERICNKGSIEAAHRMIRKVIPKGTSINRLTQKDIDLMMCHINSYTRKSLGGENPITAFSRIHGNSMVFPLARYSLELLTDNVQEQRMLLA